MKIDKDKERSIENELYLRRRTLQLSQWQRVIDRLISRAVKAEGKNRRELHRHIIKIQVSKDRIEVKLKQLSETSNHMWDNIKIGMEKNWKELRETFLKASAKSKK